ncbi:hypothetical protein DUNSADRAFT_1126 [Dunaliella salina]|uniref:Encoded protein n=1 Tax=Dunaliella salina TaxID=3046 RepID=A0ABQ7FY46_DUNSA|nr:hypothetical protein DUNSADRAFT_1126 [Dunaliella salina]|eukprot:KAF5827224.1 hypothetical protein DUNSADRAFT_1126 [Dunaliella salina]
MLFQEFEGRKAEGERERECNLTSTCSNEQHTGTPKFPRLQMLVTVYQFPSLARLEPSRQHSSVSPASPGTVLKRPSPA